MGWVHNLQTPDPNSHISRVNGVCLSFATAACIAVALRFHVRINVKKSLWVDDYATLSSAVLEAVYAGLTVAQTRWGLGLSAEYLPEANEVMMGKMQYIEGPTYTLALLGFKISLLASYLRIGGFVKLYRVVIFAVIAACIARQWDKSIPGTCINTVASYYGIAGTSLGFDAIIIALPLPILAKLQLKLRQKILLGMLFSLGFFVTIIQIIRIFTVKHLKTYTDSQAVILWSHVEVSLGIIISCVPTYGPYFRALAINISSYRRRPTQGYGQSYGETYGVSSRNAKGTSRIYDNSMPMTGIIGSGSRMGDNDSQESILAERNSAEAAQMHDRAKGMGIRIATEVRVETGPREPE
ncbi:putative integral membrane protein (Pth11) [Aspergillus mulundensis]|uniref:Rhodopsin domain-containing protein n=1 Tax=Aspergillus mulundensis TaxID=1810919 RepID=A0A3D8QFA0_9EURO|nr:Uncharacterized protein DSM5745_10961 [Aspergillus mulundensis]RDW60503.1 Uncharacterized protein DSM5745_10961 [Aspergillus mulundensis]